MNSSNIIIPKTFNVSTRVDPYGAYVIWKSVELHFTTKWNLNKGMITRFKKENFYKKEHMAYMYARISNNYTTREMILGYIEICGNTDQYSFQDFPDALINIKKRLATNDALLHDINAMKAFADLKHTTVYSLFRGNNPIAVRMYTKGYINIDTLAAIDTIYDTLKSYKGFDPLLEELMKRVLKYKLLFDYDQNALKNLLGVTLENPP